MVPPDPLTMRIRDRIIALGKNPMSGPCFNPRPPARRDLLAEADLQGNLALLHYDCRPSFSARNDGRTDQWPCQFQSVGDS